MPVDDDRHLANAATSLVDANPSLGAISINFGTASIASIVFDPHFLTDLGISSVGTVALSQALQGGVANYSGFPGAYNLTSNQGVGNTPLMARDLDSLPLGATNALSIGGVDLPF